MAFVRIDDDLYELDGRKEGPIVMGKTSKEGFMKDAAKACQELWIFFFVFCHDSRIHIKIFKPTLVLTLLVCLRCVIIYAKYAD